MAERRWMRVGVLTWTRPHCWHTGWPSSRLWAGPRYDSLWDYSPVESDLDEQNQVDKNKTTSRSNSQRKMGVFLCDSTVADMYNRTYRRWNGHLLYLHTPGLSSRRHTPSWGWRGAPTLVCCRSCRSKDSHRSRGRTSLTSSVSAQMLEKNHVKKHLCLSLKFPAHRLSPSE